MNNGVGCRDPAFTWTVRTILFRPANVAFKKARVTVSARCTVPEHPDALANCGFVIFSNLWGTTPETFSDAQRPKSQARHDSGLLPEGSAKLMPLAGIFQLART